MKKLLIFVFLGALSSGAFAASAITTCPAGYTSVVESAFTIVDGACPAGTTNVDSMAKSTCLVSAPAEACFLYAPANTDFTDNTGTYQFSDICPLG